MSTFVLSGGDEGLLTDCCPGQCSSHLLLTTGCQDTVHCVCCESLAIARVTLDFNHFLTLLVCTQGSTLLWFQVALSTIIVSRGIACEG